MMLSRLVPNMSQIAPSVTKTSLRRYYLYHNNAVPQNYPPCEWGTLPNGMKVISEKSCSPLACVGLFVEAGPRFEAACNNGITHFIEHMAFKGIRSLNRLQFECTLQFMGARLSAQTTRDLQYFTALCFPGDVPSIINIFSKIVTELDLNSCEMEAEKCRIRQEMEDTDNDPKFVVSDYLHATAFQGTPLAQSVIGPSKNLESFDESFVRSYMKDHYQPCRFVLSVASSLSHQMVMLEADKEFSSMISTSAEAEYGPYRYTGGETLYRNDAAPFAHVAMAFEVPGYNGAVDHYNLMLLKHMVGRWHRSQGGGYNAWPQLAQVYAVEKLVESYETFYINYRDVGLWGVYYVVEGGKDMDVVQLHLHDILMSACTMVTHGDAERARNSLKLAYAKTYDGCMSSCIDMGKQMMYWDTRKSMLEVFNELPICDHKDLMVTAEKYFYNRCPVVAAYGPTESLPEYTRTRAGMYWLRY